MIKYLIQPLNEGQDLNYSEIKEFNNPQEVKQYTKNMAKILKQALPRADISVEYEVEEKR